MQTDDADEARKTAVVRFFRFGSVWRSRFGLGDWGGVLVFLLVKGIGKRKGCLVGFLRFRRVFGCFLTIDLF